MDQDGIGAIEAKPIVRAEKSEVGKDLGSLDKERPLLRKECFERAKIDDGRIDFNLTEVRIHSRIENHV